MNACVMMNECPALISSHACMIDSGVADDTHAPEISGDAAGAPTYVHLLTTWCKL